MVIFHSYVSLPEGMLIMPGLFCSFRAQTGSSLCRLLAETWRTSPQREPLIDVSFRALVGVTPGNGTGGPSQYSPGLSCRVCAISVQDITIVFDDEALAEIRTHASVLTLASPVFRKMLSQEMKEKQTNEIKLPGKCPEEFKVLLEFLQPATGRLQKISDENVDLLLRWCDEYCIQSLHGECIEYIKVEPPSVQRVVQAYCAGLDDYAEKYIDQLLKNGEADWSSCYKYPELVQKLLERSLKSLKLLRSELVPKAHLHKNGKLDFGHKLTCTKCTFTCGAGWQCQSCAYKYK